MSFVEAISIKYTSSDSQLHPIAIIEDAFRAEVYAISAFIPKRGICEWIRMHPISNRFALYINGREPIKHIILEQQELLSIFEEGKFVLAAHF